VDNVLITYQFTVKPGTARQVAALIEEELVNSRKAEGCIDLKIFLNEESSELFLYELWESQDHVTRYLEYRAREKRPNPVEPFLTAPRVRRTYEQL
jgi:quinol monooxygenase YgiN